MSYEKDTAINNAGVCGICRHFNKAKFTIHKEIKNLKMYSCRSKQSGHVTGWVKSDSELYQMGGSCFQPIKKDIQLNLFQ